ncbi:putative ABC transport system permease protein [Altererythrobacter xiamenensis]|uniref:Putative ABC transport system permease protein n=1 Tax=Altererythrobacter xiamenensis TaxID=1316679 RepID=A0A1Y6EBP2_9SPHN|nr:FtsX-like permease family protein [Altererythrobacter xiamenensis]SMQ59955.1 putative ABC transport system permease protein [Altererythrobacter xiamenensis]
MSEPTSGLGWGQAWRIARRDLNARFKGLRLLLVCIFLGTAALAAIGTLSSAIERELASRGQELLGGDLEIEVWQRDLNAEEQAALSEYGAISGGTRLQAMATTEESAAPVELKAVDDKWPLYGILTLADGRETGAPSGNDAWVAQGAMDRLDLAVGETFNIGTVELVAAGVIDNEPDRLSEGFQLGPTIIVAENVPQRAGLLAPGSMYQSKYRVAFDQNRDPSDVEDTLTERYPEAGFDFRTRDRASPGADRFVEQMGDFLTLVGLAALVIAGIGIGGGVTSYLEARRGSIATLKVLGATSGDILRIYALQIGVAALIGSLAGIAVGILVTPVLGSALQGLLPVEGGFVIEPAPLILAGAYGLLVAFAFAATPLLRARSFPAMALMRSRITPLSRDRRALVWTAAGVIAICALAIFTTAQPLLSAGFLGGAAFALVLLAAIGFGIRALARRAPRASNPLLRGALANLHRPGAPTGSLVTALGFGLASFVLLAAVQSAIDGNIDRRVPQQAPDYFVLDIPRDRVDDFEALVRQTSPEADIRTVPALRGAVLEYGPESNMQRVSELEEIPEGGWALRGERGLTYSETLPDGNVLTEGEWWPADYNGEPLVSLDAEFAEAVDLEIGDYITVGVLGVERTARVANLRQLDWESMGFNYVYVFSSNALESAPHNLAATIELPEDAASGALLRDLVREFPSTSVIEVGQVLTEARTILEQVGLATLAAASVAVLAGLAVLMGAIAAARASRTYDTVVLRVLGASRRQVLLMQLAEYGVLALLLAVVALGLGSTLAWVVITQLFEFDWLPDWGEIFAVLGLGLALVVVFAVAGSLPLLKAKPAQALREL